MKILDIRSFVTTCTGHCVFLCVDLSLPVLATVCSCVSICHYLYWPLCIPVCRFVTTCTGHCVFLCVDLSLPVLVTVCSCVLICHYLYRPSCIPVCHLVFHCPYRNYGAVVEFILPHSSKRPPSALLHLSQMDHKMVR